MTTVLIADDNQQIRKILTDYCIAAGFEVFEAEDGLRALDIIEHEVVSIALLDVMMPRLDGFETCRRIRLTSSLPIIMITARGEDYERIMGLEIGADDYIVKPFVPAEVIARIKAILRRIEAPSNETTKHYKNLMVDIDTYTALIDNEVIYLTKKEIEILWTFISYPKRVFERDTLLNIVWGEDYEGDIRTVDTHIKRLRSKLDKVEKKNWGIETVWGLGYRLGDIDET